MGTDIPGSHTRQSHTCRMNPAFHSRRNVFGQFNSITPACLNDLIYPSWSYSGRKRMTRCLGALVPVSVSALRPAADNMVFNSPASVLAKVELSDLSEICVSFQPFSKLKVKSALARK